MSQANKTLHHADPAVAAAIAAATSLVENAKRLGLLWTLRAATIDDGDDPVAVIATYDGDTQPLKMTSLIGPLVFEGTRVYAIAIPPAGNYIVGYAGMPPQLGIAYGAIDTNSGAIGAETAVITTTDAITIKKDRAYMMSFGGQLNTSVANTTTARVRKDSAAGAAVFGAYNFVFPAATNEWRQTSDVVGVNLTGADIAAYRPCLTIAASAGTTTVVAAATRIAFIQMVEIGNASDYPGATSLT